MPYLLRGTCVVDASGKTVPGGCHPSRTAARRHLKALYANVPDATLKAGNYGARAGQVITGNLARGGDGKFTSAGKPSAAKPVKGVQLSKPTPKKPPKAPKAPKRTRGRAKRPKIAKPKKTDEQRRQERDDQKLRERQANRDAVKNRMAANDAGLGPAGFDALMAFSAGQPPSGAMADGLIKMGLAERANDGSVRMSAAGRATVNAANRGDYQAAIDAISKGTDQEAGRRTRTEQRAARAAERERRRAAREAKRRGGGQDIGGALQGLTTKAQTAEERAMFAKMGGGGGGGGNGGSGGSKLWSRGEGGKRQPTRSQAETHYERREAQIKRRVVRTERRKKDAYEAYKKAIRAGKMPPRAALDKARAAYDKAVKDQYTHLHAGLHGYNIQGQKEAGSFAVFKDARGRLRWIARSTTAYRDRDREILTTDALDTDSQRMTATKQFGPLRWWHVGKPDPFDTAAPWGTGLDLGDCDYSVQIGRTRVESGTFKSEALGQKIAATAGAYELSPGFFHAADQPQPDGAYTAIRTFERSLVPVKHGRASNLFTGLTVKEFRMDATEVQRRLKAMGDELGLGADQLAQFAAALNQTDKAAEQQGIAYKSDDAPQIYLLPDGVTPGIIQDGRFVALKAAAPPTLPEPVVKDDGEGDIEVMAEGEMPADDGMAYVGDLSPDEFKALLTEALSPLLDEFKGAMGGAYVTKKEVDERTAEIASLKEQQTKLEARLKELEGDQPLITDSLALKEALASTGPQAPPDPNVPQVPNDPTRPMAPQAAALWPELYKEWGPNGWPVAGSS